MGDEEIANVDVATGEVTTRQVRRAEERASAKAESALAKMAQNSADEMAKKMLRMRTMLFAIVRREGRVRLTQAELNAVEPGSGLDVKVGEDGTLTVSYKRGRER